MSCWLFLAGLCGIPSSGSAPDLAFSRGEVLLALGDDSAAVLAFDEVVDRFPASPRAGDAAMAALEVLNREQRFDEFQDRVERWASARPLVLRHRALARELRNLQLRFVRRDGPPPHTDWEREALDRLAEFADNPTAPYSDELLYEAGWQFYVSDHPTRRVARGA